MSNKQEGSIYTLVPEYLPSGRNLLDQPPISWLEYSHDIFPEDFFRNVDSAFIYFLRAVVMQFPWKKELQFTYKVPAEVKKAREVVAREYLPSMFYAASQLNSLLEQYGQLKEYLREFWKPRRYFSVVGEPVDPGETYMSYAGYYATHATLSQNQKWLGLEEILPDASAAPDVMDSMPAKGKVNRLFRVYQSEALK